MPPSAAAEDLRPDRSRSHASHPPNGAPRELPLAIGCMAEPYPTTVGPSVRHTYLFIYHVDNRVRQRPNGYPIPRTRA